MPPHRMQRIVQYSAPARPPMTRKTLSWPPQSGQFDRTAAVELISESSMASLRFLFDDHAALVEIVDAGLGVADRRFPVGPGKTDFQLGKRNAVDDHGLVIRPPDPGVP